MTGARAAFKAAGKEMPPLRYKCVNRIPYARGMGSSSAAIIAGLLGGLVLAGHKLPMWGHEELLQLACGIEVRPAVTRVSYANNEGEFDKYRLVLQEYPPCFRSCETLIDGNVLFARVLRNPVCTPYSIL